MTVGPGDAMPAPMLRGASLVGLAMVACASKEPPPAAAPPAASASAAGESAGRALTRSECESLAQWILDACSDHANVGNTAQTEGFCGDVARRMTGDDRPFLTDCAAHVKVIDSTCFRSTTSVRKLMDCDAQVAR